MIMLGAREVKYKKHTEFTLIVLFSAHDGNHGSENNI